jgi:glucose/arabinose dehydrogenase
MRVLMAMFLALAARSAMGSDVPLHRVALPEGFVIEVYAEVKEARSLALSPSGTVFVGSQDEGRVVALVDSDGDGRAEKAHVLAEGLFLPNGVAFHDGTLYIAEVNRIVKMESIESRLESPPEPVVVLAGLPDMRHHGWKYLAFGPDGWLYFNVGAPCNVCESVEEIFASISRVRPDGTGLELYARGVRQSVGFDWHPETGHLWFTDNGRDFLGDDQPGDELNVASEKGQHFGYPYCFGMETRDPYFGAKKPCSAFVAPARELEAHVAAIGMTFYRGSRFPPEYRGRIFVAEHGSWNRSERIGYRIMAATVEGNRVAAYAPFATGWIGDKDERPWGRPADILELDDGSLLVSDDRANVVYRIRYER